MQQPTESLIFPEQVMVYGTFWRRFAAAFIDGIIVGIPMTAIFWTLLRDNSGTYYLISTTVGWLYDALQESGRNQATIGKKAMGLMVTDMEGRRISFAKATGRHFGKIISGIILCIGYLMMLWDARRQTLHDKMAGTLVLDREQSQGMNTTL